MYFLMGMKHLASRRAVSKGTGTRPQRLDVIALCSRRFELVRRLHGLPSSRHPPLTAQSQASGQERQSRGKHEAAREAPGS